MNPRRSWSGTPIASHVSHFCLDITHKSHITLVPGALRQIYHHGGYLLTGAITVSWVEASYYSTKLYYYAEGKAVYYVEHSKSYGYEIKYVSQSIREISHQEACSSFLFSCRNKMSGFCVRLKIPYAAVLKTLAAQVVPLILMPAAAHLFVLCLSLCLFLTHNQ
jgi:hypothetical protein